ncbi:MAG: ABC transporter substrate-binding protein [Nitrosopumilus sp.]|nr:ABC transporter substrate-binding protein [Nitrosopumilus sp.]NRA05017.1 ABC transporter substrate-binding protein [Nitrosopumilus sp.]
MKSKQLLSIVFSLIMFTGITAGNAVFAESDDNDNHKVKLDSFCEMNADEKRDFVSKHDKTEEHLALMNEYCSLDEAGKIAFLEEHKDDYKRYHTNYMKDMADKYCEMSNEEKRNFISEHDKVAEHVDRMNAYCSLDDDARATYIDEHKDDYKMNHKDMRAMTDRYCEMSNEEKRDLISKYDKSEERVAKMNEYCDLDEESKDAFIADFKKSIKDKMMDKPHMDYDRVCALSESDRAAEIIDADKLARISNWCEMSTEEREEYTKEKHDGMTKDSMKGKMMDKSDKARTGMKMSDMSPRLKEMITSKHGISDERQEEIKMKFNEKHGELTDKQKSNLKMKFADHMRTVKVTMTDDRKSAIHDRVAEMKVFKAELRERASEMTNEEKQQLREEFIEKAKDMQLAWISPRTQTTAGVDPAEVECREGFNLVMKASNGVPMCLKSDTALKMIDRGIAVPAN